MKNKKLNYSTFQIALIATVIIGVLSSCNDRNRSITKLYLSDSIPEINKTREPRILTAFFGLDNGLNDLNNIKWVLLFITLSMMSCKTGPNPKEKLEVVTYGQFDEFVKETGYITDAEKFGWSIVQTDVFNFHKVEGANWRKPDGQHRPKSEKLPVTQVSYNDAIAYCEWSGSRLPTYAEYWRLIDGDDRKVMTEQNGPISAASKVNVLGNVWEITSTKKSGNIRLAGGSIFCSPNTCHGTKKERELYVDKQTGNIHIGFTVIK